MSWPAGHPSDPVPMVPPGDGSWIRDTYEMYLTKAGVLGHGFRYGELVDVVRGNKREPWARLWANIVPALRVASELRRRLIERGIAAGLIVAAAYRPTGGASRSAHKQNRALDLDLFASERTARTGREFVKVAAELYAELLADGVVVGMGTYGPGLWSSRIHIDVGHQHPARPNTWTIHRGKYLAPAIIEVLERSVA